MTSRPTALGQGWMVITLAAARLSWRVPEWWVAASLPAVWAVLLTTVMSPQPPVPDGHLHHAPASSAAALSSTISCVLAMMVPLLLPSLRRVANASLWQRRQRAQAGCVAGYLMIWIAIALVLAAAVDGMRTVLGATTTLVLAAFGAVLWQRTSTKRTALRSCHLMLPLAPLGWRADRDCITLGVCVGVHCVVTCWALMAVVFAAEHHPLLTLGVLLVTVRERFGPSALRDAMSATAAELRFAFHQNPAMRTRIGHVRS